MSWIHGRGGYHLLCNRDEKHTRSAALGPAVKERNGVRFIAPTDPDSGGAWIAVNEFGVSTCLLNATDLAAAARTERTSRGLLVTAVCDARSVADARGRIVRMDLVRFAPFTLVAMEPDAPASVCAWDGARLSIATDGDRQMPLTSSSYDAEGVRERRMAEFQRLSRWFSGIELLRAFHASHGPEPGKPDAYSVCMHRSDAATVSFSEIRVAEKDIDFVYSPAALCRRAPGVTVRLSGKQTYQEQTCLSLCG